MKKDRQASSRNDDVVIGLVAVLGAIVVGWLILLGLDRSVPDSLSTLAVGIVGGVLGYVTAGRSKAQPEPLWPEAVPDPAAYDDGPDIPDPPPGYHPVDPGLEGDTGPDYGSDDDDWFEGGDDGKA